MFDSDTDLSDTFSSTEYSESSLDTASSDNEEVIERRKLVRIQNFIETVVPAYEEMEFKQHFRMRRETADFVIQNINGANILPVHTFGRNKISTEKALYMTLWYLGNQETYRQIADRFDVTKSAAHNTIRIIVEYLVSVSPTYIKWPSSAEMNALSDVFAEMQNIHGIVGAIDGCHIKILKPQRDQHSYCNRKGEHSLLLQGVCDQHKRFLDVFCGEAGSIHDARLLKRSKLYELAMNGQLIKEGMFLLGDSAYPNLPWLVPPFKDNGTLTGQQKLFNYRHSSTRIVIENAFGLLKGRFRRLKFFENLKLHFISKAVIAACVLHNICINFDDLDMNIDADFGENENEEIFGDVQFIAGGVDRRQEIFEEMFNLEQIF